MNETPPNIDAILASIRSRMNDDPQPEMPELRARAEPVAPAPVVDIGNMVLGAETITVDALVRSLVEPMLKAWLDANMPEIVEKMAQAEIKRLTGRD
ncbi:MAG: DUF2497 domain-containing protein [Polymorphobacter sp.]